MAPVAAEIIAGRPPANAITTAIENEAYSPILGSTPAMIENAIASGMSASATTIPDKRSPRILPNHSVRFNDTTLKVLPLLLKRLRPGHGRRALAPPRVTRQFHC